MTVWLPNLMIPCCTNVLLCILCIRVLTLTTCVFIISIQDAHRGEREDLPILRTEVCQQRHAKGPHPQPYRSVALHIGCFVKSTYHQLSLTSHALSKIQSISTTHAVISTELASLLTAVTMSLFHTGCSLNCLKLESDTFLCVSLPTDWCRGLAQPHTHFLASKLNSLHSLSVFLCLLLAVLLLFSLPLKLHLSFLVFISLMFSSCYRYCPPCFVGLKPHISSLCYICTCKNPLKMSSFLKQCLFPI